jgi:hypothetical protein
MKRLGLADATVLPLDPSAAHPGSITFGSYLNILQRQGYLEKTKSAIAARTQPNGTQATQNPRGRGRPETTDQQDSSSEWRWGARAEVEIGEKALAKGFIAEMYKPKERSGGQEQQQTTTSASTSSSSTEAARKRVEAEARKMVNLEPKKIVKRIEQAAGGKLQDAKAG